MRVRLARFLPRREGWRCASAREPQPTGPASLLTGGLLRVTLESLDVRLELLFSSFSARRMDSSILASMSITPTTTRPASPPSSDSPSSFRSSRLMPAAA